MFMDDLALREHVRSRRVGDGPGGPGPAKDKPEVAQEPPNLDIFLNPDRQAEREHTVALQREKYQQRFAAIDSAASFDSMFELLWYSGNPCFDVMDLTSDSLHQKSVVKQCLWKGEEVNCSSVFTLTPTDRGMCCRFDIRPPGQIFQTNRFTQNMERLRLQDRTRSLDSGDGVLGEMRGDPGPEVGRYKGLSLVLDAHSDLLSARSVAEDSNGFLVGLSQPGQFPLMSQGSHLLRPGMEHFLSISATDTVADPAIESNLQPAARKCYFPSELPLQFHLNYSQPACLFECGLSWAASSSGLTCLPWFFPPLNPSPSAEICDPWDTQIFLAALRRAPRSSCTQCLPDCQTTTYTVSTSSALIRPCSQLNEGLSNLCKYSSPLVPPLWSTNLASSFSHLSSQPSYLDQFTGKGNALRRNAKGEAYSAYEEDIAMVHLYWDSPSVLQFQRSLRLTWIDYLSQASKLWHRILTMYHQVGGLFGLMLGFSLVSFIEILYWLSGRLARNCMRKTSEEGLTAAELGNARKVVLPKICGS